MKYITNLIRFRGWIAIAILIVGLCPILGNAQSPQNKAIYLGWGGTVDTQQPFFDNEFDYNHTLAAWVMPQYQHSFRGPIFTNDGNGYFFFGWEDYHKSILGVPILTLQIGASKRIFLVPGFTKDNWHHVALVRKGDVFEFYLDGAKVSPVKITNQVVGTYVPDTNITLESWYGEMPQGNLRFGRNDPERSTNPQFYGFLDDVGVFNTALSVTLINTIRAAKRLSGYEFGLAYGWSFDQPGPYAPPLPQTLGTAATLIGKATRVSVSADRLSIADRVKYYSSNLLGKVSVKVELPFPAGEVWKVIQGFDDGYGSHNGDGAFTYDLVLYKPATQANFYPDGSKFAPIYSGSTGNIVQYSLNDGLDPGVLAQNVIRVQTGPDPYELLNYRHFADWTLSTDLYGGYCEPTFISCTWSPLPGPSVAPGQFLAKLGAKRAHLHFGGINRTSDGQSFPVAFEDYYMSADGGATWKYIPVGYPQDDQLIKRIN